MHAHLNPVPLLLSATLLLSACGRSNSDAAADAADTNSATANAGARPVVRGVVQSLLTDRGALMIQHEEIVGVMPGMTMAFTVSPEIMEAAQPGQTITGELVMEGATMRLENVEIGPAPAGSEASPSTATPMGMGRGRMGMGMGRGMMGMGSNATPSTETPTSASTDSAQLNAGQAVYQRICIACHLPTGTGLPPLYPPLAGSDIVTSDPAILARIVLHGLQGPLTVNGRTFNSVMPGQGAALSDADIAAVLTYIRNTWGNSAAPVTPEVVAAERAAYPGRTQTWTWAELNQ